MRHHVWRAIVLCLWTAAGALAQQTTGNITGRILDQQGAAVPGVTVTAKNAETGFSRSDVERRRRHLSASTRCRSAPTTSRRSSQGFSTVRAQGHRRSTSAQTPDLNFDAEASPASAESVTRHRRNAADRDDAPRRSAASSTSTAIESLPLNGRQFANLAATIPGVGLGFHSRPDQEHAVLAADRRRQRPQRQLPDRRRRQQRRHGRRPAAALPARGDPGVQLHHRSATRPSTAAATAA